VIASVGSLAQMVGAQSLFVHDPNAATIVTLVRTATTLPMMLLTLPAGVLADAFDRCWLMFGVQIYFIVVAALLAGLTAAGLMPPALLLTFTFAVGAGQAMLSPTWQALITELVPRTELAAATRLDMVSVNISRAAGPALAGLVIAHWGVPPVFAMTAVCSGFLAVGDDSIYVDHGLTGTDRDRPGLPARAGRLPSGRDTRGDEARPARPVAARCPRHLGRVDRATSNSASAAQSMTPPIRWAGCCSTC
jgi:MFS family permease